MYVYHVYQQLLVILHVLFVVQTIFNLSINSSEMNYAKIYSIPLPYKKMPICLRTQTSHARKCKLPLGP